MSSKIRLMPKVYETSVKPFVVCTLELYLSLLLMVSLFHSPDPHKEDIQELQTTYHMVWVPLLSTLTLLYSAKLLGKYGPDPENFDRNLMVLKITMWIYAFVELVVDEKMVVKSGPAFTVAIIFCVCDMLRFHMEASRLIYDDTELEEEVDRLASMVIAVLENDDDETMFKHAVRDVIQRHREQSMAATIQEFVDEAASSSSYGNHKSIPIEFQEKEETTKYGTLAIPAL